MRNEDLSATGVTGNQDSANEGAGVVPTVAMDAAQKSPVVVRADAIRVTPGPDGLVTLPAGVDLADIHVVGRDLVIDMPDGTQMIIVDGAVFVPQLIIGSVEVPPTNLAALLIDSEPTPAAGNPQSSGGNFGVDVPDLDPPAPLGDLLPPTELTYTPPEVREQSYLLDDDVEVGPNPTVLLDDDALEGGNPGGDGDDSPDTANTSGTLSGEGNDTPLAWNFNYDGAPAGFTYVQDGDNLLIQQNGITVIEVTLNTATGQYTVTQIAPIDHSESGTEDNIVFNISYTVTDVDGDFANGILTINADDDTPVVSLNEFSVPDLLVDETELGTDDDGVSFAGAFNVSFGADGDGGLVYSLTLSSQGVDSGLVDTATGEHIFLYNVGGGTVEGRVGGEGGPVAFVVEVDGSGNVSLDQVRALVHPDNPDNYDETIDIDDGVISLTATATDGDGDEASESIDLGGHLNFDDDGPFVGRSESSVPDLNVDETDLGTDDSASFASLFFTDFGADGDGGSAYSLTLSEQGADSGLVDTETGEHIYLYNVGDGTVEGRVGGEEGPVAFVVAVDGDGNVSLDQQRALVHPDNPDNYDETIDIDDGVISITLTITDGDGDQASQSADIGGHLNFDDDGPSIGRNEVSVPDLNVDETDLDVDATGVSFAGLFNPDFGADGDGGTAWSLTLSMQGADSGLVDTETGLSIFLYNNGDGTVEGRVGGEMGDVAFVVSVNGDGEVSLDQQRALVHPDNPDNYDETIDVDNGVISLTLTITDGDGDEASSSVDIGSSLNFDDDGPSISLAEFSAPDLNVDETDLDTDDSGNSFAGAFDVDFGADGDGGVTYSLTLASQGVDSGLVDTETGQHIYLYNDGAGTVEGRVGGEFGLVAFVVSVNGDGEVSLDQQRALVHPDNPDNYDETIDIDDGIISLSATATDGDGDEASASIDIGGNLNFDDDGPSIFRSEASVPDLLVDETNLAADDDNNAMASLFGVDFGADGDGGVTYALTLSSQGVDSGLDTTDGTSIFLYNVGGGLVEGRVGGEMGAVAFTITVDGSGNVSLDQILSLYHPDDTDHDDRVDINDGVISLTATATDGDGDEASLSIDLGDHLNFDDDGPSVEVSADEEENSEMSVTSDADITDSSSMQLANVFGYNADYGADGQGAADDASYAISIDGSYDPMTGTAMSSGGDTIYLYQIGNIIYGSTSSSQAGLAPANYVFTVEVDPDSGQVDVTQYQVIDHAPGSDQVVLADNLINASYTVTVEDGDGDQDTDSATIDLGGNIKFNDDAPVAVDDEDTVLEGSNDPATGNVITDADPGDAGDSDNGADDVGNDVPATVVGIVTGSDDSIDTTNNGGGYPLVIAGDYGTLTIYADGSYSYALDNGNPDVNTLPNNAELYDYFTYTIEDYDGDHDSAVLTITIIGQNEAPQVTAVTTHVSEEGLGGGNEDTDPMGQDHTNDASVNGTFTFNDADGDTLTWSIATPAGSYFHADGTAIVWVQVDSHTVEGRYGAPDGAAVITVTVDDSGNWSATLHQPMDHGNDGNTESEFSISFDVTVDDGTEETVSSLTVYVEDDKPVVAIEDVDPHALQTDDSTLGTDDAEYGDAFSVLFGGDGPDDANAATAVEYTLGINAGSTGLFDTATGLEVQLTVVGGVVFGYVDDGGTIYDVFTVSVDGDGTVTLQQYRAVEHGDSPDNYNESTGLVGSDLITLTATATDEDGDTDSKTIDLTGDISFLDDGPAVTATITNESAGMAITDDDGSPSTDSFELSSIFGYNPDYGNDGQGATPVVETYLLELGIAEGGNSGLTSGGAIIYLYINDAGTLVTASTSNSEGGVNGGNTVFTVAVDGDGTVTLTQSAPLDHVGPGNDSQIALPNGLINANYLVTIIDGDDDQASDDAQIDLGGNLKFNDDTPSIEGSAFNGTVILDETDPAAPYPPSDPDGTNGSVPRSSGTANLSTSFTPDYGADVPGDVTYGLSLNGVNVATGLYALDNSESDGQGLEIVLNQSGDQVIGTAGPGGTVMFIITMNADTGVITFTQFANLWHDDTGTDDEAAILNLAAGTLQATAYATDYDGDDSSVASVDLSVGVFQIEDSGVTLGTIDTDLVVPNAGLTPSATGDFQYDVGTDGPQAGSNDGITEVLLSSVLINGVAGTNVSITYNAITDQYEFQFDYQNGPDTTATATGEISFDPIAGTYTVTLESGPIEGFSLASTSGGTLFQGYEAGTSNLDNSQPEVAVTQISSDLFVQFTGVYEPASGTGANNLTTTQGAGGAFGSVTTNNFNNLELFTQAARWVSTSNDANGVGGDTIQGGEVLDFNLYSTNPTGFLGNPPDASAESMFIKLDGVGSSEDFIVILKLYDPDTGNYTTRALMVQNSDIQKGPGTGPGAYSGITLDNNDGLVIIESNDYNGVGENWVIVGAQIAGSDEGITGTAINFNNALGPGGASIGTQPFSADVNDGPFKVSDIGFLTTTTLDQTVELQFDVTIKDGDGDSEQVTLNVTIDGVVENPLVANAVEKVAVGDTSMSSLLAANDDLVMVSRGNGTQSLMMASAVALMAGHQSALIAKGIDTGFDSFEIVNTAQGVHTSVAAQQAIAGPNVDVGFDGDVREAIGSDGPAQSNHMVSREAVVEFDSADARVEAANDASGSDGGAAAHTAAFAQDALVMPTADLSMPTAEALAAMEQVTGQGLEMAAKDVIEGLETGDDLAIDAALAGLESHGKAIGLAEVASVPAWDMGDMGGFTHDAQAIMVAEAMVLHHDAVHSA